MTGAADGPDDEVRWDAAWRERSWQRLGGRVDVVVVGGGVVGAGVALLAARSGVRVVLLERGDFASGTSSRSSQQVHGGLRYLAQGRLGLARSAVAERERLLCADRATGVERSSRPVPAATGLLTADEDQVVVAVRNGLAALPADCAPS